jgi:peptidoglycan/xylan/chitin deacetylase (PgdA/CDA1 family)
VLTHDVETARGYEAIPGLLELERSLGYRSSWNLVPGGYDVDVRKVERLVGDGFEVGVHGWRHDGRDFVSHDVFRARLPQIRRHAELWGAQGFRAPSSLRVWEWMPELGFDYDSSYSDTAPFEPQPGGCCSVLPFFNEDLVELPVTMPQDHTLFVILGEHDEALWRTKAEIVRGLDGMALMLTHPDYATPPRLAAYRRLLDEYQGDESAWRALPREVSAWWRARAASRLEPSPRGWRIAGPAAGRGRVASACAGAGTGSRAPAS